MAARKGILGEKLGMTQIFDAETSRAIPVTVLKVEGCRVAQVKSPERDGYSAVQLALVEGRPGKLNKPDKGHLSKAKINSRAKLVELRTDTASEYKPGQKVEAGIFAAGEKVDAIGISKGKGFAGVMKRHNFKGLGASHGTHRVHRSPGAIGACATPARVFKGTRMAGQLGARRVTNRNLTVVEADDERGLLLIKGSVPGAEGSLVLVRAYSVAGAPGGGSDGES